uniref:GP3 protein n=1 Tax=Free State vervet virus TaxID=1737586 RepID=A0A161D9K3_9NIDO|nr:GP3 protein [Free State vervet virus]
MGHCSIFALLTLSSLLCSVYSFCFVLPDPDIHISAVLNYTTCHMQGSIIAGYQSLSDCHSYAHNEFTGHFDPLNITYITAAPVGALVLGLSLLRHRWDCAWHEEFQFCCNSSTAQPSELLQALQPLPHLVILLAGATIFGIMSVCLVVPNRSAIKRD